MKKACHYFCYSLLALGLCSTAIFAGEHPKENLKNPSFEKGLASWSFYVDPSMAAQVKHHIDKEIFTAQIKAQGAKPAAHVQLIQTIALKEGQRYKLSFDVKREVDGNATMPIICQQKARPWENYGLEKWVPFSKDWTHHDVFFTAKGIVKANPPTLRFYLGNQKGDIQIRKLSLTETTELPEPKVEEKQEKQPEHLKNSSFEKGMASWSVYVHPSMTAQAKHHVDNGIFTAQVKAKGPKPASHVQLIQKIALKEGQRYKLSFDVKRKGDGNATMPILCQQQDRPWENYGLESWIHFSKDWSHHDVFFTAKGIVKANPPNLRFYLGNQKGEVQLRKLSLIKIDNISKPDVDISSQSFRIVPQPKRITRHDGFYQMGKNLFVHCNRAAATDLFQRETIFITGKKPNDLQNAISPMEQPFFAVGNTQGIGFADNINDAPPFLGGYALVILPEGIAVKGFDDQGLRNGIQSLLQIIEQSSKGTLPLLSIRDLPDMKFRAMHVALNYLLKTQNPANRDLLEGFRWMFRRLGRYKYTHICLMLNGNIKLEKHPEVRPRATFSHQQIKQLIKLASEQGVVLFPNVKTFGKFMESQSLATRQANADVLAHDYYTENGAWKKIFSKHWGQARLNVGLKDPNGGGGVSAALDIASPKALDLMRDCIDEVYELFNKPKLFHLGMDEYHFFGSSWPKEVNRGKMFADYINALNRHLNKKGCQVMIWSDMLLSNVQFPYMTEANGGPPQNTCEALPLLDKNIIIADWHYGNSLFGDAPKHYPTISWFRQNRFNVVSVPWYDRDNIVNIARDNAATSSMGIMGSTWAMYMTYYVSINNGPVPTGWGWTRKRVEKLRELGVFASTAEAAWNVLDCKENIEQYDSVLWEKRWMPQATAK
ncbi:MAG: carbohydrate binding domain-containing protein [Phycisphaeraceae bacterium]|nr:carbohydrate binding domain-containing protein [Phycisphaeraceae bacterium]